MRRTVHVLRTGFPDRPAVDNALARTMAVAAGAGEIPETFRLYEPGRVLAFGPIDLANPGYEQAAAAARRLGFTPVHRFAGGKAAVFHEETLAFAWAIPEPHPKETIKERFSEIAGIVVDGLRSLGADARVGEVQGEYCPGSYSVNVGGTRKVMGVGQRLVRGAAHVGGVVVVGAPGLVNEALTPAYEALGYEWDPAATGAVADTVPATMSGTAAAILSALAARHEVVPGEIDPTLLAAVEQPG
jgi:lipoate-protein ligase A